MRAGGEVRVAACSQHIEPTWDSSNEMRIFTSAVPMLTTFYGLGSTVCIKEPCIFGLNNTSPQLPTTFSRRAMAPVEHSEEQRSVQHVTVKMSLCPLLCKNNVPVDLFIRGRVPWHGTYYVLYSTSPFPADLGLFSSRKCAFLRVDSKLWQLKQSTPVHI